MSSILEVRGDMLSQHGGVQALVNPVNCVGVMGAGLALQFKRAWPDNFNAYVQACKAGQVRPGKVFAFDVAPQGQSKPRWILNIPTKRHWKDASRLDDIEAGLADLVVQIRERGIDSVAIPPLGCGLGGLDWMEVRPRIMAAMSQLHQVRALVFGPHPTMSSSEPMLSLQRSRPRPG
jgi:O-acetyl-ADP-ribose deacetylase (regulator of RNase III)